MPFNPFKRIVQLVRALNRRRIRRRRAPERRAYQLWILEHDSPDAQFLADRRRELELMTSTPVISVLMPVYNARIDWLAEAVQSVRTQVYPHWELCIADDCSTDPRVADYLREISTQDSRIKIEFRKVNGHISQCSNSALALCSGLFTALMDQDDLLAPHALLRVAQCVVENPEVGMIYSDEDKVGPDGLRESPSRKPDWDPSLLLKVNQVSHLGVYKTELMRTVGGFRKGYEGAQDHDLALRCSEQLHLGQIAHISEILYHWRMHPDSTANSLDAKPYVLQARKLCLEEHETRMQALSLNRGNAIDEHEVGRKTSSIY